jgi:surface antigen
VAKKKAKATSKKKAGKKTARGTRGKKKASQKTAGGARKKKASKKATGGARKKKASKQASGARKKKAAGKARATPQAALPKVGQRVQWRALPGTVYGEVVAILKQDSTLNGKPVKASPEAPRIKLKSDRGKLCVHKPESVQAAD